jgi:paraquat-inducible protein B
MNEQKTGPHFEKRIPAAVYRDRKYRFSIVWVVPLVAAIIGAWLLFEAGLQKGPTIKISFKSAEDLEIGKTMIKYKNVDLGKVADIDLSPDLSHVVVTAQLARQAEQLLSENTRFWVARARLDTQKVSDIGTIFSGAYIGLDPGKPGKRVLAFKGLETPPVVTTDLPGGHFILMASRLGSLNNGAPVYYRQIKVGKVVSYQLTDDNQAVEIRIFIHAPYHKLVLKNTRFWNASGLDVTLDARGIRMNTESLVTLLVGGIAFETPADLESGVAADANDVFKLYENRRNIFEKTYARKRYWLLHFDGSVRGLETGAPVEFRGIRVGRVVDIKLVLDQENDKVRIPVLIEVEPDRINDAIQLSSEKRRQTMDYLVSKGLRARLKMGSLITGKLFVDIDFYPDALPEKIVWEGEYPLFPTMPTPMDEISATLGKLLNVVKKLPAEEIANDLHDTVKGAKHLVNSAQLMESAAALNEVLIKVRAFTHRLEKTMAPDLEAAISSLRQTFDQTHDLTQNFNTSVLPKIDTTLEQMQATLKSLDGFVGQDTPLQYELTRMLQALAEAARSIRVMADYLQQHPDALIRGKGNR